MNKNIFFSKKTNFVINFFELKYRTFYFSLSFIITFLVCFTYKIELFFIISNFFFKYESGFIYTNVLEPFIIYIKLTFFFTSVFVFPIFIYLYGFFFLRSFKMFYVLYFILFNLIIYFFSLFFFIILSMLFLPVFLEFFLKLERQDITTIFELILQATMKEYYNFFIVYFFFYLLIILVPCIFLFSLLLNVFDKSIFVNYIFRKYLYFIIIFIFLLFSPPDFFLQLLFFPIILIILEIFVYFITFLFFLYYSNK